MTRLIIKEGVKIVGLKPEALLAINIAFHVYKKYGVDCVITEITGGAHGTASLHYVGLAFDLRTRDFNVSDLERVKAELKEALGSEFDVVLESDHLHLEWQPK